MVIPIANAFVLVSFYHIIRAVSISSAKFFCNPHKADLQNRTFRHFSQALLIDLDMVAVFQANFMYNAVRVDKLVVLQILVFESALFQDTES